MQREFERIYKGMDPKQKQEISERHLDKKPASEIAQLLDLPRIAVEKVIKGFTENLSTPTEGSELYKKATAKTLEMHLFPADKAYIET